MPICICPECSKPHKIPVKNLGLKGRCTQCRAIFTLIEHQDAPRPVAAPVFVPPPQPVPDPEPAFEPDTFSLRHPEPPAPPAVPKPPEPEEPAEDAWMDEIDFNDEDDAPGPSKGRKSGPRGEVASLPRRPALTIIATVYTVVGGLFLLIAIGTCIMGVMALIRADTPQQGAIAATFVATLVPVFAGCIVTAVSCIAFGEVIHWGIAIESRLHEISKNQIR